jgi:hypothetical protein
MRVGLVLLVFAAGCAHTHSEPSSLEAESQSDTEVSQPTEVTLTVPRTGPVHVHLVVPRERLPERPEEVEFAFSRVPESHNRVHVHPPLRKTTVSSAEDLILDYDVDVPALSGPHDGPLLFGSFDGPRGRHLVLWSLLPTFSGALHLGSMVPATVQVHSPLPIRTSLGVEDGGFVATDLNELYSGLVLAGRSVEVTAADGLRLVSFDFEPENLARLAALEGRASQLLLQRFGPRRPLHMVAVHLDPSPFASPGLKGINTGPTAIALLTGPPDGRASSLDNSVFLHELVHSSLPPEQHLLRWMTEGFTEYITQRLSLELDGLPERVLRERLADTWDAFVETTPSRRPSDTTMGDYYGGAVLAYCIDVRLRRDHGSLEAVLKRARSRAGGEVTNAMWEEEIALASAPAGALVVNARTEPLDPVATCFTEGGFVARQAVPGVRDSYLRSLLGVTSVNLEPRHADVLVTGVKGGPLAPGDAIVEVGGVRVVSLAHLKEVLATRPPEPLSVVVSRQGALQRFELPVPPPRPGDLERVARPVWLEPRP